jgi:hypothetical protein
MSVINKKGATNTPGTAARRVRTAAADRAARRLAARPSTPTERRRRVAAAHAIDLVRPRAAWPRRKDRGRC